MDNAEMLSNAYKLQKSLEAETIELEESGARIVISGDFKVKSVSLEGFENTLLRDLMNKAIRKVQERAATRLKELSELKQL